MTVRLAFFLPIYVNTAVICYAVYVYSTQCRRAADISRLSVKKKTHIFYLP